MNSQFSNGLRTRGYKYYIDKAGKVDAKGGAFMRAAPDSNTPQTDVTLIPSPELEPPTIVSKPKALEWVKQVLIRTRGKELPGNYNPLLIGELFWEQSSKWRMMAEDHVERVAHVCSRFLNALLREKCPKDVYTRLWSSRMEDALQRRSEDAFTEIGRIMEDIKSYPITYNHYYTDTIHKRRHEREQKSLSSCIENATQQVRLPGCQSDHTSAQVNATKAAQEYFEKIDPDMERHSCEEALDCLYSIYKLSQKTFIDNITTQVVERHIVRGLEKIFSPIVVNGLSDPETKAIASEPPSTKRPRDLLENRIEKLKGGHNILQGVIRSAGP